MVTKRIVSYSLSALGGFLLVIGIIITFFQTGETNVGEIIFDLILCVFGFSAIYTGRSILKSESRQVAKG